MAKLHLYDDEYIETDDIISIEFKKDKKYFVTKDSYEIFNTYIRQKNIYYDRTIVMDNIKNSLGACKHVEYILIKLKGDHVIIMYDIIDSDDMYVTDEEEYIELMMANRRLRIGEPAVEYWVKSKNIMKLNRFKDVKDYIIYNIL